MSAAAAPRLDAAVSHARKLAGVGLAGAVGLARGRWIVAGIMLGIVGLAIGLLIREADEVRLRLALAPIDDESESAEEQAAVDAARSEAEIPWETAKKELTAVPAGHTNV